MAEDGMGATSQPSPLYFWIFSTRSYPSVLALSWTPLSVPFLTLVFPLKDSSFDFFPSALAGLLSSSPLYHICS